MILFGEDSLRRALKEYLAHYHRERNHQGLENRLIERDRKVCPERLGGLPESPLVIERPPSATLPRPRSSFWTKRVCEACQPADDGRPLRVGGQAAGGWGVTAKSRAARILYVHPDGVLRRSGQMVQNVHAPTIRAS
jgi:hypothetical protein